MDPDTTSLHSLWYAPSFGMESLEAEFEELDYFDEQVSDLGI